MQPPRVAIVGIGGIFPQSPTLEHFWANIRDGLDTARAVPPGRWVLDPEDAFHPSAGTPDRVYSRRGCFIGDFHLDYAGFGPTELRIVIAAGNLALYNGFETVNVMGHRYRLFDVGGVVAALGMAMVLVYASIRHTIQLFREERLP